MTNEANYTDTGHTGYEYREITVPGELSSLCMDSYPCFGWEQDPNQEAVRSKGRGWPFVHGKGKKETVTLHFRRKRSLCNKTELTRLQRNFDGCVAELQALERSKTTASAMAALAIGLIGTAFLAGSVFAVTAQPPVIWLTVLLGIPGLIGWIVPCFFYRNILRKRTEEIEPLKERTYDEIDQLCEKGSRLLY